MKKNELRTSMFAFGVVLALLLLFGFQNCSPMLPLDGVVDGSSVAVRATATPGNGSGLPTDTGSLSSGGSSAYDGSCTKDSVAQPMAPIGVGNAPGAPIVAFTNPDGRAAFWNISKGAVVSASVCWMSSNSWKVAAVGDFNGDLNPDVVWQDLNGNVVVWLMSGSTRLSSALIGKVAGGWRIEGAADFNGDGKTDLLWRNQDGSYLIWYMNGTAAPTISPSYPMSLSSNIVTTTDFDGDGHAEILWNTGGTYSLTRFDSMNNPSSQAFPSGIFAPFSRVIGFGDFSGDLKTDFFGIKNTDGFMYARYMNGTSLLQDSPVPLQAPPASWTYLFSADLNSDGIADAVWTIVGTSGTYLSYTSMPLTPSSRTTSFPTPIQSGFSVFQYPHL